MERHEVKKWPQNGNFDGKNHHSQHLGYDNLSKYSKSGM